MKTRARKKRTTPEEGTAYHEAGTRRRRADLRARRPKLVSLVRTEETLGRVELHGSIGSGSRQPVTDQIVAEVVCAFAGMIAEKRATGRYSHAGARRDKEGAVDLLMSGLGCSTEREASAAVRWLWIRAEAFVDTYWYLIEKVAKALCDRKSLTAAELDMIVSSAGAPPG